MNHLQNFDDSAKLIQFRGFQLFRSVVDV